MLLNSLTIITFIRIEKSCLSLNEFAKASIAKQTI